jgi:hypothetical protein
LTPALEAHILALVAKDGAGVAHTGVQGFT